MVPWVGGGGGGGQGMVGVCVLMDKWDVGTGYICISHYVFVLSAGHCILLNNCGYWLYMYFSLRVCFVCYPIK